ncbi:MAG: succinate dehydrogenase, partial [Bacteroidetes bacterium]|nr:succinate dehydrogenase [Bacteroidota bacterium]
MAVTAFHTYRKDTWWLRPLLIFSGLTAFIIYTTWAAFQGDHYTFGPYLSPFYSPEIFGSSPHAWFGPQPSWWPAIIPFSPAFIILAGPAGMRFTCYYYRGSYYKAFWADPPACTVTEPRKTYKGEHSFPLIMQNIHRYFFYPAAAFVIILAYDAYKAMWFTDVAGEIHFGMGIGTLVLAANAT